MKKYYADIYHVPSNTHVTIGEYSEEAIEKSITACLKQKNFNANDCIWTVSIEEI